MLGKKAFGFKDAFGKNIVLEDFIISEQRGGFTQIGYYNPLTQKAEPKKDLKVSLLAPDFIM